MLHGRTISGMLSATLLDPHHIYDPDNPGSPLYGLIRPQLLVRLRMQTAATLAVNAWHTLWTGYLDNIERQDVAAGSDQVTIQALDIFSRVVKAHAHVPLQQRISTGAAMRQLLLQIGIPAARLATFGGIRLMDNWWVLRDQRALLAVRELEDTEGGFVWVNRDGIIEFEAVDARVRGNAAFTLSDSPSATDIPYQPPRLENPTQQIVNSITASVRTLQRGDESTLWSSPMVIELAGGQVLPFHVKPKAELIDRWITPVATTDYTANSAEDGTGTDHTARLRVGFTSDSQSAQITLTNTLPTTTIYIRDLKVRGHEYIIDDSISIQHQDQSSIDRYGVSEYELPSNFLSTIPSALNFAQYLVNLHREPLRYGDVTFPANQHLDTAGNIEISQRCNFTHAGSTTLMFIEAIQHTILPGLRHHTTLTLAPAYQIANVIVLGPAANAGPGLGIGILGR